MVILLFIFVLLVCVLVHEWGHYISAKKSGMLVEEFGFGIPPRIWSWKKGETTYSLNALPIGGFVKIAGENGIDQSAPRDRQFETKPWYLKTLVLVAGVIMNFVLAVVLFVVAFWIGLPGSTPNGTPTVVSVVENSPVAQAHIAPGDSVTGVSIGGKEIVPIDTMTIHEAIVSSGKEVTIAYTHSGEAKTAVLVPREGMIGVSIEKIGTVKYSFWSGIGHAWTQSVQLVGQIFHAIAGLVGGIFTGEGSVKGLIGPVGLAKEVGTAATFGVAYLLAFIATISLNLAVLNIMPFPALDGGRLLIVWGEALTGKKFSPAVVGWIHAIGFLILITLMIVLTVGDIKRVL